MADPTRGGDRKKRRGPVPIEVAEAEHKKLELAREKAHEAEKKANPTDLTPAEVGAQLGRIQGDYRFTQSEKEAAARIAAQDMERAKQRAAEERKRKGIVVVAKKARRY